MTETQTIWLILAIVYGFECLCWLPRASVGFRTWLGRRWTTVLPAQLAGNQRGGLGFSHPLPPLGSILIASPFPMAPAPESILVEGRIVHWSDAPKVSIANKTLLIDGKVLLKLASNAHAAQIAAELNQITALAPAKRAAAIQSLLRRSLDVNAVRARWEEFRSATSTLRWLCNGLLAFIFGIAPLMVYLVGLHRCWWTLLAGLFALTIPIAIVSRRHHKRLYPAADDDRFALFLTCLLSPASAVRALDLLSRPLLVTFHPLAAARAFCGDETVHSMAATALRQLRFVPEPREPGTTADVEKCFRTELLSQIERWLHGQKIDPVELLRSPKPADPSSVAYCPRCLAQFTSAVVCCHDCGGIPLHPFKPAA